MFELILNAAKLATSEEARKSASALVEFIRKSPEWQQDICTLEAKIPKEYEEQSLLLNDLTASKLENLEYTPNAINAFINVYSELTRNGFEHGCRKEKESIKVIIEITKTYVSVSVINPKWRKFDVQKRLKAHTGFYESDSITERGRGLVLCNELADSLKSILNQTGIKAVIYKDRVEIGLLSFPGLVVMNILNGENNPSLVLKLSTLVEKYPNESIILHFNRETGVRRTDVDYFVRRRNKQNIFNEQQIYDPLDSVRANKKSDGAMKVIILFTDIFHSKFYLPDEMVAHTWEEALAKLGKSDLLPIIFPPQPDETTFPVFPKRPAPPSENNSDNDIFNEFRDR